MAEFPNNIFDGRQLDNVPGQTYDATKLTRFYAEDHNRLIDEIEAIETTLGENPQGAYDTVKDWLTALAAGGLAIWGSITGTLSDQTDLQSALDAKQDSLGFTPENVANKATDLSSPDNTKYPTTQAVSDAIASAVVGLLDYRGSYDASTNLFPATGGSGIAGVILKGDFWLCSVAGTLGGTAVSIGDFIIALVDTPAQTASNWDLIEHDLGYVPENVANKDTDGTLSANSDTKYASQKATKTYADTKQSALGFTPENVANKDATGGYVGMTLFKHNFKNALNTITSFFTNANTVARTYTFQNRDGTIADDTDLAGKVSTTRTVNGHALSADVTVSKSDVSLGSVDNLQQLPLSYLDTDGTLAANSDTKVPSQKAVKTYVDGKVSDTAYASSWNGVTTVAPSKNAIYDAKFYDNDFSRACALLGSTVLFHSLSINTISTSASMSDGQAYYTAIYINRDVTLTGVKFYQVTQGAYTADNNNYVALYSYSGGTLTRVAISSNNGNLWKAANDTMVAEPFSGTYAATPGVYFIAILYNSSAVTTAPVLGADNNYTSVSAKLDFTNSAALLKVQLSQTSLPSSVASSSLSTNTRNWWVGVY